MISKYIALLEPLGVFAMIVAYIWRWRFRHPLSWIAILGLVLVSHVLRRETPASLGFRVANLKRAPAFAPLMAAIAFSAIHTPNWFLIIVTFFAGFACAKLYLKFRNLYALGLAHGVIGFLLYLCVPDTISHHLYVGPKWFA